MGKRKGQGQRQDAVRVEGEATQCGRHPQDVARRVSWVHELPCGQVRWLRP